MKAKYISIFVMNALSETYLTWAERVIQERPLGFLVKKTLCFYTFMEKQGPKGNVERNTGSLIR